MKLTYIYHSGFALEGEGFTVIIDYYKDSGSEWGRGVVHDYLLHRPGKLYVLASHFHPDHFNPEVLEWKSQRPDIIYVFSKDILKRRRAGKDDAVYLVKLETYEDEILKIKAYGSTDVGISFLIETAGKKIFHAGDLNNWHWNEESTPEESRGYEKNFLHELEVIAKDVPAIDLAMFPVDPRLGKDYMRGAQQFVDRIKIGIFVPMHFDEAYDKADAFGGYASEREVGFWALSAKGNSIDINGNLDDGNKRKI